MEQQQRLSGHVIQEVFVDHGYRGIKEVKGQLYTHPKLSVKKLPGTGSGNSAKVSAAGQQ